MLLQALYDFVPRDGDSNKTLAFRRDEILLFLEIYPKDENWLEVADRKGHIGYIPRNYVEMNDDIGRDAVLEFLLAATFQARRDTLETIETLESLKDHVVRIEYREFQTKLLRKALNFRKEESEIEIEDGTSHDGETYPQTPPRNELYQAKGYKTSEQQYITANKCESNTSCGTLTSERSNNQSVQSAPVKSRTKVLSGKNLNKKRELGKNSKKPSTHCEIPVAGRASKSCPLGPKSDSTGKFNVACTADADKNGSGDNIATEQSSNQNTIPNTRQRNDTSRTRIPVRTSSNMPLISGRTYTCTNSARTDTSSNFRQFGNNNADLESTTARLVKIVQESGGLNTRQSEVVVHRVLHHIHEHFHPNMPEKVGSILRVLEKSPIPGSIPVGLAASKKLQECLQFLSSLGKQTVREGQAFIEDESVILEQLDVFHEELTQKDPKELKYLLESDKFNSVHDLVILYQSEGRGSIKNKLLELFSMISTMSNGGRSILLRSTLPIELAREIYENDTNPTNLSRIGNTLISLLSSGERMPETHYDHLGTKFLTFILSIINEPGQIETNEKVKVDLVKLILAYNLQFTSKDENLLIKTLAGRTPGRYFIESMIYLFEKETDPIKGGSQSLDNVPHSVFKLMKDMFSSKMTAEHFHTAEMKVLIDLVTQSLVDLGPGDNRRTDYLEFVWLILRNRSFQYRISDLRECLVAILLEEDPLSIPDQRIVKGISKEFPTVFAKASAGKVKSKHLFEDADAKMPF